jgi:acetyl esterase
VAALELAADPSARPAGVLGLYPVLDFANAGKTASYRRFGDAETGLSSDDMLWFRSHYAPRPDIWRDWRCSPILANALSALPAITLIIGAHDVLYSENIAFARRFRSAGVALGLIVLPDANHGFLLPHELIPSVADTLAKLRTTVAF